MSYDLTLTSATFGTGKYGQALTGGYGVATAVTPVNNLFTIEAWVNFTSTGLMVGVGADNAAWIGAENGKAEARGPGIGMINAGPTINDGAWHHIALTCGASVSTLWVDGVSVGTSAATTQSVRDIGVGAFTNGTFPFTGAIDEAAVTAGTKYTGTFTPGAIANSAANLIAVWHLDGNGTNSQGVSAPAATALTLTAPTTANSNVGTASGNFTVAANGTLSANVTVTPSDSGGGGTFNPTSITLTSATTSATFTYTPGSSGAKSISVTNNGGLTNPAAVTYTGNSTAATALTLTPPASTSGAVGVASGAYTVGANGVISGTVTVTPSDSSGGGTFSPASVQISSGTPTATFTYTPGSSGTKSISVTNNGSLTNPGALTYTVVNDVWDVTKVVFSPYNWNIVGNTARTINRNAYFRASIAGTTSCVLKLDITGIVNTPQLSYRLNKGAWTQVAANTATVTLAIPNTTDQRYLLEVVMETSNQSDSRWTTQTTGAKIIGMVLDAGGTLSKPASQPLNALYYGDSITDGEGADFSYLSYSRLSAELVGCEFGIVAFGSTGLTVAGAGGVPALPTTYNYIYSGVPRTFSPAPDFIVMNEGTNDGATGAQANAITVLNGLLAATPSSTKIIVLRPFNGNQATDLQNAVAGCSNPSRCTYVDTTGFYTGVPLHPNTDYTVIDIAPKVAAAIRNAMAGTAALTARTVSLTLGDTSGVLANLTGLKVAFYDEATPDLHSVPRYKSSTQTTNASGVLSFTAQSTLAGGGTGCLVVQMADGRNLVASVVVA